MYNSSKELQEEIEKTIPSLNEELSQVLQERLDYKYLKNEKNYEDKELFKMTKNGIDKFNFHHIYGDFLPELIYHIHGELKDENIKDCDLITDSLIEDYIFLILNKKAFDYDHKRMIQIILSKKEVKRLKDVDDIPGTFTSNLLIERIDVDSRDKPFVLLNNKYFLIGDRGETHASVINKKFHINDENYMRPDEKTLTDNDLKHYIFGHICDDIAFIDVNKIGSLQLCIKKLKENGIKKVYLGPEKQSATRIAKLLG